MSHAGFERGPHRPSEPGSVRGVQLPHPHPHPRAREVGGRHRRPAALRHLREEGAVCGLQPPQHLCVKEVGQLPEDPSRSSSSDAWSSPSRGSPPSESAAHAEAAMMSFAVGCRQTRDAVPQLGKVPGGGVGDRRGLIAGGAAEPRKSAVGYQLRGCFVSGLCGRTREAWRK